MQKNAIAKAIKMKGSSSHPIPRSTDKKHISTGTVMRNRVIATRRRLGCGADSSLCEDEGSTVTAAACRDVEIRDTATEPTEPGRPMEYEIRNYCLILSTRATYR